MKIELMNPKTFDGIVTDSPHGIVPAWTQDGWFTKMYSYMKHTDRTLHIVYGKGATVAYMTRQRMLDATTRTQLSKGGKKIQQDITPVLSEARLRSWAKTHSITINTWVLEGKRIRLTSTPTIWSKE